MSMTETAERSATAGPSETAVVLRRSAAELSGWNAYLAARGAHAVGLRAEWSDVLAKGLGHRPCFLEARRGGRLVGVLPLALVSSMLFGRRLASLPYVNVGGPVADDADATRALLDEAIRIADAENVKYLEIRATAPLDHPQLARTRTDKSIMVRELPSNEDELWKLIPSKARNHVRRAEKHNLTYAWGRHDLLDAFYDVFAVNMRDLGTPVYGKRLFREILDRLADDAEICVVRKDGQAIAAGLALFGPEHAEVPSASSLRAFNDTACNMLLYHRLFVRATERGCRSFDMGRSSADSGTYKFKVGWGATPTPSVWHYYDRESVPSEMRVDSPKYRRLIATWKRLPVWLTRLVGPAIVRGIP